MKIAEFQQLLGYLFRTTYKGDMLIQRNLLELGWATERLLVSGRITPFDVYEEKKNIIFEEMEWSDIWK